MAEIKIREIREEDLYFVGTCSHVNEGIDTDKAGKIRADWLMSNRERGVKTLVALHDNEYAGFMSLLPIEVSPWGPVGEDLLVLPCLDVLKRFGKRGIGKRFLGLAKEHMKDQKKKGLVTFGYDWDWFMPASFFLAYGFQVIRKRNIDPAGETKEFLLAWSLADDPIETDFLKRNYDFKPVQGKVKIDLFWNPFCQTSIVEAGNVREVTGEFPEQVILQEYDNGDLEIFRNYRIPRGIFINGREVGWGYEAPKEGLREVIKQVIDSDKD